ncbi:MAG: hypothetical protein HC819_12935 [Cyclobacteriaceae bacterium]|nr:hypothetical protein [Cyclobacteriaceae bacterium]
MKSDLNIPKVSGVEIVAAPQQEGDELWDIYLINRNDVNLKNVLIASKGYGQKDGKDQKTSTLRHMINDVEPQSMIKIEPIQKQVFHLTNEYWVSYYIGSAIYDKKFIFVPDSIQQANITKIDGFDLNGVWHK